MPLLFCTQCGYNMKGSISSRCPECGQLFAREAFRQFLRKNVLKRKQISKPTIYPSLVIIIACIAELFSIVFTLLTGIPILTLIPPFIGGLVLIPMIFTCTIHSTEIGRSIALKKAIKAKDATPYLADLSASTRKYAIAWLFIMLSITGVVLFIAIMLLGSSLMSAADRFFMW